MTNATNLTNSKHSKARTIMIASTLAVALLATTGCDNALQGGASGAALGALAGMGLGSLGGHMGQGAAGGAITGAILGGMLGDQNARSGRTTGGLGSWGGGY